jgi:O-antigen ligase
LNTVAQPKQPLKLPTKHVGSFLLLIIVATFNLSIIWPNFTLSLEPITILIIGLLLIYKIYTTLGFAEFFRRYKIELALLVSYFLVCLLSLYLNIHRYADGQEVIRYGITFIVITASFPAGILLFILPQNTKGLSLSRYQYSYLVPWIYFLLLALMTIWQYFDFESSKHLSRFFVSSEIWPEKNINGFFRVSTDTGVVFAIAAMTLVQLGLRWTKRPYNRIFFTVLLSALMLAGLFSGSRTFLLVAMIFVLIMCLRAIRFDLKLTLLVGLTIVILFHLLVIFSAYRTVEKLSVFLPYLLPLRNGSVFFVQDLWPNFSMGIFADRLPIWESALVVISENPLLGISNGGFRLYDDSLISNTHSLPLQFLVDSGWIGMLLFLSLMFWLLIRLRRQQYDLLIVMMLSITLLLDFQFDHSLPWIITIAFLLSQLQIKEPVPSDLKIDTTSQARWSNSLVVVIGLLVICSYGICSVRSDKFNGKAIKTSLAMFISSRSSEQFYLIDSSFGVGDRYWQLSTLRNTNLVHEIELPEDACLYDFDHQYFIQDGSVMSFTQDHNEFLSSSHKIGVYSSEQLACQKFDYPTFDNTARYPWLSRGRVKQYTQEGDWLINKTGVISSPLFNVEKGEYVLTLAGKNLIDGGFKFEIVLLNDEFEPEYMDGEVIVYQQDEIKLKYSIIQSSEYRIKLVVSVTNEGQSHAKKRMGDNVLFFPKTFSLNKL